MSAPGFWDNQEKAQVVVQQVKAVKGWIEPFDAMSARVQSARGARGDARGGAGRGAREVRARETTLARRDRIVSS